MTGIRSIDTLDVKDRRVLLRADLNVPMKDGKVTDATRIDAVAPTVSELVKKGARVIVLSHFGRPKGKANLDFSLKPLAAPLAAAVSKAAGAPVKVSFASDCVGPEAEKAAAAVKSGEVLLFENVRFHAGEEANDPAFVKALAKSGDLYVNDAFSCAHRAHASTEGLAHVLPSAAGRSMAAEIDALKRALHAPERPVAALVGGAKISTKLELLGNLVAKVDHLIIGGGMANTFLNAIGKPVGKSLCEHDLAGTARDIIEKAKVAGCRVHLPVDAVVAGEFKAGAASREVGIDAVKSEEMILDIGPQSVAALEALLDSCRTLLWNGPLGAFEIAPFDAGTVAIARFAADLTRKGALLTVAGGGDTVAALNHAGAGESFSHVSTAGGAFLEWLEGKSLPGVAVLEN